MDSITISMDIIILLLTIVGGILMCFRGYKMFKAALVVVGAAMGACIGERTFKMLAEASIVPDTKIVNMVLMFLFAIAFGGLAFALYKKAIIFLTMITTAYYIYSGYCGILPHDYEKLNFKLLGISLGIGLVIGIAVFFIQSWAIKIATAFLGAKILSGVITSYIVKIDGISKWSDNVFDTVFPQLDTKVLGDVVLIGAFITVFLFALGFAKQFKDK